MGRKENGLWIGTVVFAALGLLFGIFISAYAYIRTLDKSEGGKYQRANCM